MIEQKQLGLQELTEEEYIKRVASTSPQLSRRYISRRSQNIGFAEIVEPLIYDGSAALLEAFFHTPSARQLAYNSGAGWTRIKCQDHLVYSDLYNEYAPLAQHLFLKFKAPKVDHQIRFSKLPDGKLFSDAIELPGAARYKYNWLGSEIYHPIIIACCDKNKIS